jgi:biopolymer transport protein TolQ
MVLIRLTMRIACVTLKWGNRSHYDIICLGGPIHSLSSLLIVGRLQALIEQTGWVAKIVLGILLFLSLFSWAIILSKSRLFSRIDPQTRKFLQVFRAGRGLADPRTLRAAAGASPLAGLYEAGFRELQGQLTGTNPPGTKPRNINAIGVEMRLAAAEEVRAMEKWMSWLATIGSVSPFIGLFGTVLGVMDAFEGLGDAGAASLRAVAPGIAEALITTAAGLFAAIPAVIAYNQYLQSIRSQATRMDNFTMEFVSKIETLYS